MHNQYSLIRYCDHVGIIFFEICFLFFFTQTPIGNVSHQKRIIDKKKIDQFLSITLTNNVCLIYSTIACEGVSRLVPSIFLAPIIKTFGSSIRIIEKLRLNKKKPCIAPNKAKAKGYFQKKIYEDFR